MDKNGNPYNNQAFANYCFMTYVSNGKVMTSPAGGPYFFVVPPTAVGMDSKGQKETEISASPKGRTRMLPPPSARDGNLNGFWNTQPNPLNLETLGVAMLELPTTTERATIAV